MSTLTKPSIAQGKVSPDDSVDHIYCCDENESLCGLDLSSIPEVDVLPNLCVVCDDLDAQLCERCGL